MPYSPPQSVRTLTLYPSTATTATHSTDFVRPPRHVRGVRIWVNATAETDTASVVFTVEVKNDIDNAYATVLTSAAVTGISSNMYEVYPGGAAVSDLRSTYHIGSGFRVTCTHADADSLTYAIRYAWLF